MELDFSGFDIDFKADVAKTVACSVTLDEEAYRAFVYAVQNHYWYQVHTLFLRSRSHTPYIAQGYTTPISTKENKAR